MDPWSPRVLLSRFPWLRTGRAFGTALSPTQLLLAFVAVQLWRLLLGMIDLVLPSRAVLTVSYDVVNLPPLMGKAAHEVLLPWWVMAESVPQIDGLWSMTTVGKLLWCGFTLLYWTGCGLMLSRAAAVQLTRDVGPDVRDVVQRSYASGWTACTANLTPLGFVVTCALVLLVMLLPGRIPWMGDWWLTVANPLILLAGIAIAVIVCLLPLLWPLMLAAVAVDDVDTFGAFSRAGSYLTTSLWSAFALLLLQGVAALLGQMLITLLLEAGASCVSMASQALPGESSPGWVVSLNDWKETFRSTMGVSLCFSHTVVWYLCLRQQVDGTPWSTLAGYDEDAPLHEAVPVVGMPAVTE
jgi:hypothetical protein